MSSLSNYVYEAYVNTYEEEFEGLDDDEKRIAVEAKVLDHSPRERLDVYLTWNGILGWTDQIWNISQGGM